MQTVLKFTDYLGDTGPAHIRCSNMNCLLLGNSSEEEDILACFCLATARCSLRQTRVSTRHTWRPLA